MISSQAPERLRKLGLQLPPPTGRTTPTGTLSCLCVAMAIRRVLHRHVQDKPSRMAHDAQPVTLDVSQHDNDISSVKMYGHICTITTNNHPLIVGVNILRKSLIVASVETFEPTCPRESHLDRNKGIEECCHALTHEFESNGCSTNAESTSYSSSMILPMAMNPQFLTLPPALKKLDRPLLVVPEHWESAIVCSFIAQQHISGKKRTLKRVRSLHEMRIGRTLHVPARSRTMVAHGG
jgi:hypothetical protein